MLNHKYICSIMLCMMVLGGCKSAPETPSPQSPKTTSHETKSVTQAPAEKVVAPSVHFDRTPLVVDLSRANERSVMPYNIGNERFLLADILPTVTDSSGYDQKWEFYIYSKPYEVRIKYELSNFAFSKNEGKIKGYVLKYDENGNPEKEYPFSKSCKISGWESLKNDLDINFCDAYSIKLDHDKFLLHGTFELGTFDYVIEPNVWKPGTGSVYFGNREDNAFKYSVIAYHKPIIYGSVSIGNDVIPVEGHAYANHYNTNVAVYDMFDELADFRKYDEHLLVDFRYFVPSKKYDGQPFGYMFVAYDGVPVIAGTDIERITTDTWLDDANYGYEINSRQTINVKEDGNTASFEMLTARPKPSDPYADLPPFQKSVASRFAKPIEYSIAIDWNLHLNVDGYRATIPMSNTYTITRMR
ncbi:MAG: hypothetical protein IIY06_13850 [Proteobacteria bacterium]|nr:hypothetical protein [Pseudomonadota bacterium]